MPTFLHLHKTCGSSNSSNCNALHRDFIRDFQQLAGLEILLSSYWNIVLFAQPVIIGYDRPDLAQPRQKCWNMVESMGMCSEALRTCVHSAHCIPKGSLKPLFIYLLLRIKWASYSVMIIINTTGNP